jgi:integrase
MGAGVAHRDVQLAAAVTGQVALHRERQAKERANRGIEPVSPDDTVFAEELGRPYHPQRLRALFGRASERAGLPSIRLHDLRHTMASTALAGGIHPKVVQERLGHTTVAMTLDTYSHVTDTIQGEAAERLNSMMSLQVPQSEVLITVPHEPGITGIRGPR